MKPSGRSSASQAAFHGYYMSCQTNRFRMWYSRHQADERVSDSLTKSRQAHQHGPGVEVRDIRPGRRAGRLRRLDNRVDGVNRDEASGDWQDASSGD